MIKQRITFVDYNGVKREEDHYFHLSEAEVMEMEMSTSGGLIEMMERIIDAQDTKEIVKVFKTLLLKSYGEKSPDGRRFVKSDELATAFSQTEAYSQLFMKLSTDPDAASRFFNGVIEKIVPDKPVTTLESSSSESGSIE